MSTPTHLNERGEVLNRQVHPTRFDAVEGVLWEAFIPGQSDERMLSTLRGHVSAEEAFRRHTEASGLRSAGTWGVSVGEAVDHGLAVLDDGGLDGSPIDHASIDFNGVPTRAGRQQAARKICTAANERGPLFTIGDQ